MANKRSVILQGTPVVTEEGTASAEVRPGYLVDGTVDIAHHASAGGNTPRAVALERDELGKGIDNTYQGSGTDSAFYASGERVKTATLYPGCRATMFIASGQDIQANEKLESAGDGTLRALAAGTPLFRSLDEVGAVTELTAIRVEAF